MTTKKTKKKPKFDCDVNGSIMVNSALRYALGRMTYVPGAVQDWIKTYWDDLDSNTKCVAIRDVFDFLYDEFRTSGKHHAPFDGYDNKEWEKFAIDRYWSLDYDNRKATDQYFTNSDLRKSWYENIMMKKLYWKQNANTK